VEEVDKGSKPIEGVGTAVAAFVGFTKKCPEDSQGNPMRSPVMVTNWSQYVESFGDFMPGSFLAHSVYGYFNNGGGRCYVVSIGSPNGAHAGGAATAAAPAAPTLALPSRASAPSNTLSITAANPAASGPEISVEVSDAEGPGGGAPAGDDLFKLTVRRGDQEEVFDNVSLRRGADVNNVETAVNTASRLVRVTMLRTSGPMSDRRPRLGTFTIPGAATAGSPAVAAAPVLVATPQDFIGSAPDRTGFGGLEMPEDVTMLCAPDLMSAYQQGHIDLERVQSVQQAMMSHCQNMKDRVAILDAPPDMKPQQIRDWRVSVANYDSSYATLYYPWIKVFDPSAGKNILVPPCGHVAGVWSRSDNTRGVHKAPANEVVGGAIDVEMQITRNEQEILNPVGINCIRAFPGRGIRIWGARTLSSDPSWRYLNVRRLFNYVEKSVFNGTQWVVFEPNDFALWQRIARSVSAFLNMTWRSGALFGATPELAFYVKCDAETNPLASRDLGMVVTEIGIAPVKPAEFVIFRITQWSPEA
jgi:phage tail sheath protein FI